MGARLRIAKVKVGLIGQAGGRLVDLGRFLSVDFEFGNAFLSVRVKRSSCNFGNVPKFKNVRTYSNILSNILR